MNRLGVFLGLSTLLVAAAAPARAQEEPGDEDGSGPPAVWFPGEFVVAPLLANPLEVRLGGDLIAVDRDIEDSIEGTNVRSPFGPPDRRPI